MMLVVGLPVGLGLLRRLHRFDRGLVMAGGWARASRVCGRLGRKRPSHACAPRQSHRIDTHTPESAQVSLSGA
ncbi:hypothetical protein StrepF001_25780 [Streptomyces sp. F001]|nr:hypothetical protein StrepF001_25780 [Streptomyces sp. F001]